MIRRFVDWLGAKPVWVGTLFLVLLALLAAVGAYVATSAAASAVDRLLGPEPPHGAPLFGSCTWQ